MDSFEPRAAHGPEYHIQERWVGFLENKGWLVERMVGNAFQKGIPDIYIAHPDYGTRWIDIKVYGKYSFTKPQRQKWPAWEKAGIGIWIIGATSPEDCDLALMLNEYPKLFKPPNWRDFWKDSWNEKPNIDEMIDGLVE